MKSRGIYLSAIVVLGMTIGCSPAVEQSPPTGQQRRTTTVNVALPERGNLTRELNYTGITGPAKIVSVRSRVEGQLLSLNVDVGDRVKRGNILGRIDDRLLSTAVREEEGRLAALGAELDRAKIQVNNARIEVERLRLQYQQAKNDADRFTLLAKEGAIPTQQAETARTTAAVALKAVNSANARIEVERKAIKGIEGQIAAQKSVIEQEKQRQSYAVLLSPLDGVVVERAAEPGNLVSVGGEVLKIGDFRSVIVAVSVSELDIGRVRLGGSARVRLDAFGDRVFTGTITRISPISTGTARQIPVEITIANPDNLIKGGLLARVTFDSDKVPEIIVPVTALVEDGEDTFVFVLPENSDRVQRRRVRAGKTLNNKVEIPGGLSDGEKIVINSSQPLKNDEKVRVSVLSRDGG